MKKVDVWVCGNAGSWDDYNPFKIIRQNGASDILCALNKKPLTASQIIKVTEMGREGVENVLSSLLRINAVKKEKREYRINFAMFTKEDQKAVFNVGEKYGKQLAYKLLKDKAPLYELASKVQCAGYIEKEKILFALAGCFALDWRCLEELERANFLITRKKQPGNRGYILQGAESSDTDIHRLYWGSHTMQAGRYVFTSFGDHAAPRLPCRT